jgi:hypothetical protein
MRLVAIGAIALLLTISPIGTGVSWADHEHGKGSSKHNKHDDSDEPGDDDAGDYRGPYFTIGTITVIRRYYTPDRLAGLPPGLRKHIERRGHLPPGLEKKLARDGQLPPGLMNQLQPAPGDLLGQLPPLPAGTRLYFYNGEAVILNPKTQALVDVAHGLWQLTH